MELVLNREGYDKTSQMPLFHLSYIMKTLVKTETMRTCTIPEERTHKQPNVRTVYIGSCAEDLKVALPHGKKMRYGYNCCKRNVLLIQTIRKVDVRQDMRACMFEEDAREIDVIIETERSPQGYLQLRPRCPQLHKGQTFWLDDETPLLIHKTLKEPGVTTHFGLECRDWPKCASEWLSRERPSGWPGKDVIQSAKDGGCMVISRSHPSVWANHEWQFIFPHAENILAMTALTDGQRYCFYIFKILLDFHLRDLSVRLKTVTYKTILYFACEQLPKECWELNVGGCVLYLINRLLMHVRTGCIPNYFITSYNMYDNLDKETLEPFVEKIEAIRVFPVVGMILLVDHHRIPQTWIVDDILDDIDEYRKHRNIQKSFDNVCLPSMLNLARMFMNRRLYIVAGKVYFDAHLEVLACTSEDKTAQSFQEFMLQTLSAEDEEDRNFMSKILDMEYGTSLEQEFKNQQPKATYKDIADISVPDKYKNEPFPQKYIGNPLWEISSLLDFGKSLQEKGELTDAEIIYKGIIHKAILFKDSFINEKEISDPVLKRELSKQVKMQKSLAYWSLDLSLKHLFECLNDSDRVSDFREYIQLYEDINTEMDCSLERYEEIAGIWDILQEPEKAKSLRTKAKQFGIPEKERTERSPRSILSRLGSYLFR